MEQFSVGSRVRVDIPDETDRDHDRYHGVHGTIVETLEDEAGAVTGDEREAVIYRVKFESGKTADFRWRDLRPPLE